MGPAEGVDSVNLGGDQFPRLNEENYRETSPPDVRYNCIAWCAGDTTRWWQPGFYWPSETSKDDYGIATLIEAFRELGYEEGADDRVELGFEKVAIFGSGLFYTHAARQLLSGKWTSKLGKCEDIEHDRPDDVAGGVYGELVEIMKRPLMISAA
jgi:hypothetical protein